MNSSQSNPQMPLVGSYERPIRQMREVREILIRNPPLVGNAVRALEKAILDLGGEKRWGKPARLFQSSEGQVTPMTSDEVKQAVEDIGEALRP